MKKVAHQRWGSYPDVGKLPKASLRFLFVPWSPADFSIQRYAFLKHTWYIHIYRSVVPVSLMPLLLRVSWPSRNAPSTSATEFNCRMSAIKSVVVIKFHRRELPTKRIGWVGAGQRQFNGSWCKFSGFWLGRRGCTDIESRTRRNSCCTRNWHRQSLSNIERALIEVLGDAGGWGLQLIRHCPDGVTQTRFMSKDGKVERHVQPLTSILAMSSDVHRFGPPCVMLTRSSLVASVTLRVPCPRIGVTTKRGMISDRLQVNW